MAKPQRALWRMAWKAESLTIVDEPMFMSLLKYRARQNRVPASEEDHNLISSQIEGSRQHAPILDLDFPHRYVPSTTENHGHLYLDVPISHFRWVVLMFGLYVGGVIEKGNFYWSLRRGSNFVRRPGVHKTEVEQMDYTHGMFRKLPEFRGKKNRR